MKRKCGSFLIITGLLLIVAALLLAGYNVYESQKVAQSTMDVADRLTEMIPDLNSNADSSDPLNGVSDPVSSTETEIPDHVLNPNMIMPVQVIDGITYIGILDIPSLNLHLPIIQDWSYNNLKRAPCRYEGSAYTNDMILAAHNYNAHFGKLKTLNPGDQILFTDVDGNRFCYEVVTIETLMPTAVEEMSAGDWDLSLFTCTVGGANRVTVRCMQVYDDQSLYSPVN